MTTPPKYAPLTGITEKDKVIQITGQQKETVKVMTHARSVPIFSYQDEFDCTGLLKLKAEMKQSNKHLTILPFFLKAFSIAMEEFPHINAQIDNDLDDSGYIKRFVVKKHHNFGIPFDSPKGLIFPNIKSVQNKTILQINKELTDMV